MKYYTYCRKSSEAEDRQVLSNESQSDEIQKKFVENEKLHVANVYAEAMSAKSPGRPIFNKMLDSIERGEADGIICWHPDRLARNSIDGGRIIDMLDRGVIKDLKFATYAFENNSQGKFMLNIMFSYSKYYVDALSENVKRGNRAKLQRGWRPNMAPMGYRNNTDTKEIDYDLEHGPIMRKIYDLFMTDAYSVREIERMAREDWGYLTPLRKKSGGVSLSYSMIYRVLRNPFYTGNILWTGTLHPGKHKPLVTMAEFDFVQRLLNKTDRKRPEKQRFAYTGLFHCGACNRVVTAEKKTNRFGSKYVYYHCTGRAIRSNPRCFQPSVEEQALERQIGTLLEQNKMPEDVLTWTTNHVGTLQQVVEQESAIVIASLQKVLKDVEKRISALTDLRVRELIEDVEFVKKRRVFQEEKLGLLERMQQVENDAASIGPIRDLVNFRNEAPSLFADGDREMRRDIARSALSNLTLKDKIVYCHKPKPIRSLYMNVSLYTVLGQRHEVITRRRNYSACRRYVSTVMKLIASKDPNVMLHLAAIRRILHRGSGSSVS